MQINNFKTWRSECKALIWVLLFNLYNGVSEREMRKKESKKLNFILLQSLWCT